MNKKLLVLAVIGVSAVLLLNSASAETYTFSRDLYYGMEQNNDVLMMQNILAQEGCFSVSPNGWFGPITREAVKCFQAKHNFSPIPDSGYVGAYTRSILSQINILSDAVSDSNLPAGCTSTIGYSPITGQKCEPISVSTSNLPPGCLPGYKYSATTGQSCTVPAQNLPVGCTSNFGYSSVTGQSCLDTTTSPAGLLAIISPSGGETYTTRDTLTVAWILGGTATKPVSFYLLPYPNGGTTCFIGSADTTRTSSLSYSLTNLCSGSAKAIAPGEYVIDIYQDNKHLGSSSKPFSIRSSSYPPGCTSFSGYSATTGQPCSVSTTSTPSITVTSPNGGERYTVGGPLRVTWSGRGLETKVLTINLLKYSDATHHDGGTTITTTANSAGTGGYEFIIPSNIVPGSMYKISVGYSDSFSNANDISDNFFTISAPQPSITVTSQTNSETWKSGDYKIINWHASSVDRVYFYLHQDNLF